MGLDNFKQTILKLVTEQLQSKIDTIQSEYNVYLESAANETKSTAGDKHDTSKSMMQLEQEKLAGQLQQLKLQKKTLELIDPWKVQKSVQLGSYVETNHGNFFISISSKPIEFENTIINCISIQSPLGKLLQSKSEKAVFQLMDKQYQIHLTL
jgi:hypothetical protein